MRVRRNSTFQGTTCHDSVFRDNNISDAVPQRCLLRHTRSILRTIDTRSSTKFLSSTESGTIHRRRSAISRGREQRFHTLHGCTGADEQSAVQFYFQSRTTLQVSPTRQLETITSECSASTTRE
ncbi:hypothetical protein Y032_0152g2898 [Ancylostoma ceylanicum]|uniref:Uncharacterized protein n=1 Tax=Ancylostoma ceylanicum TaxID=53326 RepID=A0A016T0V1_9BILA|nr:hypothetical protein Y032_0152g2898 [Ancylostoma ceylanicum]